MGEVFRARDTRLGRDVAIKVLPDDVSKDPKVLARFENEARAVAALSHPNILALYDVGEEHGVRYAVTELLEGETLREALRRSAFPARRALEISGQLAKGLAAAHEKGIVHRDVKPENIFLTKDGDAKLLDFGLARHTTPSDPEDTHSPTEPVLSTSGAVTGTVAYMSPEQARGFPIDHRSDQFSMGIVLYEMLAGRRPFHGDSTPETLIAIIREEPEPLEKLAPAVPAPVRWIVERCLAKEPAGRYESTRDLARDLENCRAHLADIGTGVSARGAPAGARRIPKHLWSTVATVAAVGALAVFGTFYFGRSRPIPSVAVLPFVNASGNADLEYLSDGIAEELINSLTQVQPLKVIARSTAFSYKGRQAAPRDIGADLKVRSVVMGRLTRRGETITVQVDLVDAVEGSELWGGKFERRLGEIASLQQEINRQVTSVLRVKLTSEQKKRLARPQTENAEAFQLYLRGRQFLSEMSTASEYLKSLDYFKQAVQKDPKYAKGWAGLADGYAYLSFQDLEPARELMPKAREAAQKALALDPDLAEAHTSLGIVKMYNDWDLPGAAAEFRRAMELNPGEDFSRHWYAHYLEKVQRFEEANAELRRVVELDPLSPMYTGDLALQYYYMRQPEKVIEIALNGKSPDSVSPWEVIALALAYEMLGRREESLLTIGKMTATDAIYRGFAGALLARQGKRAEAEGILAEMKGQKGYVPAFPLALVHLGLGQTDETFRYLEKAYEDRSSNMYDSLPMDPQWGVLRDDPRFKDLLMRLRLAN